LNFLLIISLVGGDPPANTRKKTPTRPALVTGKSPQFFRSTTEGVPSEGQKLFSSRAFGKRTMSQTNYIKERSLLKVVGLEAAKNSLLNRA